MISRRCAAAADSMLLGSVILRMMEARGRSSSKVVTSGGLGSFQTREHKEIKVEGLFSGDPLQRLSVG